MPCVKCGGINGDHTDACPTHDDTDLCMICGENVCRCDD